MINITIDIAIQIESSANRILYIYHYHDYSLCHNPFVVFIASRIYISIFYRPLPSRGLGSSPLEIAPKRSSGLPRYAFITFTYGTLIS